MRSSRRPAPVNIRNPDYREQPDQLATAELPLAWNVSTVFRWRADTIMASRVADNVSRGVLPLSANPSRKQRCLRARAPMMASTYS